MLGLSHDIFFISQLFCLKRSFVDRPSMNHIALFGFLSVYATDACLLFIYVVLRVYFYAGGLTPMVGLDARDATDNG